MLGARGNRRLFGRFGLRGSAWSTGDQSIPAASRFDDPGSFVLFVCFVGRSRGRTAELVRLRATGRVEVANVRLHNTPCSHPRD